jgi:glutathione S-transferase
MITVHHLENSRSQRVLWLLEELGLPARVVRHARDPQTMLAPPALLQVHPLGKSPVIVDDVDAPRDGAPRVVAETGAIVEYLIERHGQGRLRPPPGTPEALRWTYWLHFAEGSAMPPLLLQLVASRLGGPATPWLVRPVARAIGDRLRALLVTPNLRRQWDWIETELQRDGWFAGTAFSAADVMMSFPIEAAAARAGLDARWPAIQDWLARIHARPAWQRALALGGPYAYA